MDEGKRERKPLGGASIIFPAILPIARKGDFSLLAETMKAYFKEQTPNLGLLA